MPNERRDAAQRRMRDHGILQRRACRLVCVDPTTVRRERPPENPEIRAEMKEVAAKRRRVGYWRIGVMLERKGMIKNHEAITPLLGGETGWQATTGSQTSPRLADADVGGSEGWRTLVAGLPV